MNVKNHHEINWDSEKISNYWDYISSNKNYETEYFTKKYGSSVARDLLKNFDPRGKSILDFGCGPGYLFDELNKQCDKFKYTGMDFSENSINLLKEKYQNNKNFEDAIHIRPEQLPYKKKYDCIVCCEVIEHLDDEFLSKLTEFFLALLKPGGILYITTPNDENLDASKSMCPNCGCIYHLWQHMRSWSKFSITNYFESNSFKTIKVRVLNFDNSRLMQLLKFLIKTWIMKKPPRNLVYICKK
jgi:2-polyprenyl-3-methyl-5-hydroxy-6-metoxy-1,4-benzoquinol methylase